MKYLYLGALIFCHLIVNAEVIVHGGNHVDPPSTFYSVKLNGENAFVHHYKVYEPAYNQMYNFVSYVHFDMDEPVEVEVTFKDDIIPDETWLSPLKDKIPYSIKGKKLIFTLNRPKKLILGINTPNDSQQNYEKEGIFAIIAMPMELDVPDISDNKVLNVVDFLNPQEAFDNCHEGGTVYFPKGIYRGQYTVKTSNSSVYLESGSVILSNETPLLINGKDSITIHGRGALQTNFPSTKPVLEPRNSDYLTIDGIIMRMGGARIHRNGKKLRGAGFALFPHYCNYLNIRNTAIVRYPHGADGIDPDNCQHVKINNNLVISGDDAICPKTIEKPYMPMVNYTVTNNIVRTGQASGFKLGTHAFTEMNDIEVEGLDMIHTGQIKLSDRNIESDIKGLTIKNVTIEYAARSILQISAIDNWKTTKPFRGNINVTIENLTIYKTGKVDNEENFTGLYLDAEPGYKCKVNFINLVIEGKRIGRLQDLKDTGNLPEGKAKIENVEIEFSSGQTIDKTVN